MTRRLLHAAGDRLTRPGRTPRWLRLMTAAALAAFSLVSLAGPASSAATGTTPAGPSATRSKSPEPPGPGDRVTAFPTSSALVARGMTLYENGCASCHGTLLQGMPGIAPALTGVGAGPVDFYLSTGRMPLPNPTDEPTRGKSLYDRSQIDALVAFVAAKGGGPAAPGADPAAGSLALGLHAFTLHCAGCHQMLGRGGLTVGAYVPNLGRATPLQIAEAVRMGPYLMPRFNARQIDQHELDSIARYVLWTRHPDDAGGWGIDNIGPIPEGMVAWFIALLAMVIVARLIGERTA